MKSGLCDEPAALAAWRHIECVFDGCMIRWGIHSEAEAELESFMMPPSRSFRHALDLAP